MKIIINFLSDLVAKSQVLDNFAVGKVTRGSEKVGTVFQLSEVERMERSD